MFSFFNSPPSFLLHEITIPLSFVCFLLSYAFAFIVACPRRALFSVSLCLLLGVPLAYQEMQAEASRSVIGSRAATAESLKSGVAFQEKERSKAKRRTGITTREHLLFSFGWVLSFLAITTVAFRATKRLLATVRLKNAVDTRFRICRTRVVARCS